MKAYCLIRGRVPRIIYLSTRSGQIHAPDILPPGKKPLVPTGQDAGWALEPLRTRWKRKIPSPRQEWNP